MQKLKVEMEKKKLEFQKNITALRERSPGVQSAQQSAPRKQGLGLSINTDITLQRKPPNLPKTPVTNVQRRGLLSPTNDITSTKSKGRTRVTIICRKKLKDGSIETVRKHQVHGLTIK